MILYLVSSIPDYLQDVTYVGLVKLLGKESVIEFPYRSDYHTLKPIYPMNCGYCPGYAVPHSWRASLNRASSKDCVLIIAGCAKKEPLENLLRIRQACSRTPPALLIDGGDEARIAADAPDAFAAVERHRPFELVFKREFYQISDKDPRIVPFPFCARIDHLGDIHAPGKKHNLFFAMRATAPIRLEIQSLLDSSNITYTGRGMAPESRPRSRWEKLGRKLRRAFGLNTSARYYDMIPRVFEVSGADYLHTLSASRVAISARGGGFDTIRYWEIPACGTLLLSERPPAEIPNNFRDMESAIFFDDISDLKAKLEFVFSSPEQVKRLSSAGHTHSIAFHTPEKRARTLLDNAEKKLGVTFTQ